jgi:hypothetical protein
VDSLDSRVTEVVSLEFAVRAIVIEIGIEIVVAVVAGTRTMIVLRGWKSLPVPIVLGYWLVWS